MAKLPPSLITKQTLELQSIAVGDTVFVQPSAMRVTSEMDMYLNPTVDCKGEKSILHVLKVTRRLDGFYLTLLGHWTWTPETPIDNVKNWLPVASVVEDYDPEVDIKTRHNRKERE